MTIDNVTAVYFSPTGNTEKMCTQIAQELAKNLRVPCGQVDFTLPTARARRHVFTGTTLVVFAMPTYAGRLPNKLLPFVQKNFQGLQSPAITLVTFGNRSADSALPELAQTLAQNGFYVLAGAFISRTACVFPPYRQHASRRCGYAFAGRFYPSISKQIAPPTPAYRSPPSFPAVRSDCALLYAAGNRRKTGQIFKSQTANESSGLYPMSSLCKRLSDGKYKSRRSVPSTGNLY